MMMKAPPEAPEGERLARLEAAMEAIIREISDMKADIRDIRSAMNRFMFAMIAMWVMVIITILFRT